MKHFLLLFCTPHEGVTIFLLEDCTETEESVMLIEELMATPYASESRLGLAKALESRCYASARFQHNPSDATLCGETVVYNINLW